MPSRLEKLGYSKKKIKKMVNKGLWLDKLGKEFSSQESLASGFHTRVGVIRAMQKRRLALQASRNKHNQLDNYSRDLEERKGIGNKRLHDMSGPENPNVAEYIRKKESQVHIENYNTKSRPRAFKKKKK